MGGLCGDQVFWNSKLTWHSSWPQFTECFQNTVLVWIPCGWLWMMSSVYVYYLSRQSNDVIPISNLFTAKLVTHIVLICTTLMEVMTILTSDHDDQASSYFTAATTAPVFLFMTLVLSCIVSSLERQKGIITSGILFVFWLLLTLTGFVHLYHTIIQKVCLIHTVKCDLYFLYYCLVVLQLVLHSFAEKKHKYYAVKDQCPEVTASFLSRAVYEWTSRLVMNGYKHPLTESDVYSLPPSVSSSTLMKTFLPHWKQICKNFMKTKRKEEKWKQVTLDNETPVHFSNDDLVESDQRETTPFISSTDLQNNQEKNVAAEKKRREHPSLLWALVKTFSIQVLVSHFPKIFCDLLLIFTPQILGELVRFTEDPSVETWKGYVLGVAMFLSSELQSLFLQRVTFDGFAYGMKIRSVLISTIFRKSLTMNNQAKKEATAGEIVNLMSVDANNINILITYLVSVWSSPLQIILALYFLYGAVGNAMFAGLIFLLLMMPFNAFILGRVSGLQEKLMKCKDKRLKVIGEVMNGIKVLKLYAWEDSFMKKIEEIRNSELHFLWKIALFFSAVTFSWTAAPYFVALTTLIAYVYTSPSHHLDAKTAFVAITYFNVIRVAINYLPMVATNIVRARVSLERISNFLGLDDLDSSNVSHNPLLGSAVVIEDASFTWEHDQEPWLKNIDLDIAEGTLVAAVGQVGCGKSSLVSALLGEMEKVSGFVNVKGSVAYVPQQAWIQNITLQDNILFGSAMDREWYNTVISACALTPDLEMLPAGDQTEIGEKGINLSGGQKQRVSLARAVYNDADIYLLDDPLSAVDSHVGKHIFKHVIGPEGLLQSKTRLLVTHGIHWLPDVDLIVVLSQGRISEAGSYKELVSYQKEFAHFLSHHQPQHHQEDEDHDDLWKVNLREISRVPQHHTNYLTFRPVHAAQHEMVREMVSVHSETEMAGDEFLMSHTMTRMKKESSWLNLQESRSVPDLGSLVRKRSARLRKSKTKEKRSTPKPSVDHIIVEEEVQVGKVTLSVYLMYMKSLGLGSFAVALVMYALYQVCQTGGNIWLSRWTDDITLANISYLPDSTERRTYNNFYSGVYGLFGGMQALCVLCFAFTIHLRAVRASRVLHHSMLTNIMRSPMSFFDTTPIGRIVNRFSQDCDTMDNQLPVNMEVWLDTTSRVMCTIIIISYTTPVFILPLVPLLLMYVFIQRFYVATSRQLKRLESKTRSPIYSHFSETLSGSSVIRAYGAEDRFINESERRVDTNLKYLYSSVAVNRWVGVRLEVLGSVIILLASILSVSTRNSVTGGIVGLSLSYATEICNAMTFLTRLTSEVETQVVSVERIKEYTQLKEEAPAYVKGNTPPGTWPNQGEVTFNNFTTRYRPGLDLILKDVTFSVKPGEKVGIVGRTGAGKSSLTLSLFRLIEATGGEITIDGLDISSLGLHDLRSKLTVLPQDPVIFTGSIRFNLDPRSEHSDTQIWRALNQAHLKAFVESLPNTMYQECGEGGDNFSVGQRQLLCLARTLLRNTKVLILDEATAAVDMETDDLIQQTIRSEFKDCTVLTIAHRLNTVMDYDRILVLDKGRIAEFDSPGRLLEQHSSIFSELARDAGITQ